MLACLKCFVLCLSMFTLTLGSAVDKNNLVYYSDNSALIIESIKEETELEPTDPQVIDSEGSDMSNPDNIYLYNEQSTDAQIIDVTPAPQEVKFTDADEYLYVSVSVLNVRVGPGTEYDKITSISLNTQVHRIGKGENGWSKIDYNGQTAYVFSDYLSGNKVVSKPPAPSQSQGKETVVEEMGRRGNIGRLTIPSVGVNVALFASDICVSSQHIVDAKDSAAYLTGFEQIIIADHRNQGFSTMKNSVPNKTRAYIDYGTHVVTYICVDNFQGHNTGNDLVDMEGNSIFSQNSGGISMYTCNENWKNITITYWKPLE